MDLLKIFLIITILSIPTGEVLRIDLTREVGINLIDICLSITAVYGFFYLLVKKIKISSYAKYFLIFIIFGLFSLLLNSKNLNGNQILISALYPIRFLFLFMILPLISVQDTKFKQILRKILVFDGLAIVILGLIQFIFYPGLRNLLYLGWDEHLYRLFSTFLDPNFTGIFLVLFIIFLVPFLLEKKSKINAYYLIPIFSALIALDLTYSRSALLSFGMSSFLLAFLNKKKYVFIPIFIVAIILLFQLNSVRSEGTNLFRTSSTKERILSTNFAISLIKKNPIFGIGFNSYRYTFERYNSSKNLLVNNFPSHGSSAPDNSFLFVLVTTGIIGFGLYVAFWYQILKPKLKNIKYANNQVIIFSTLALFIASFFINALFYTPVMLWYFAMIGVSESK